VKHGALVTLSFILAACVPARDTTTLKRGEEVYRRACARCHDSGEHGAQRLGDHAGWRSRIGQGIEILIRHSIDGYEGAVGHMPARGGVADLSDEDVAAAVDYLLDRSR